MRGWYTMAYGNRNAYFGTDKEGFSNSIWVELIGFDQTLPDYGVTQYLKTVGFLPHHISLHLTSIDFVNTYKGMEEEYRLPIYACSYGGHAQNDDRDRQDWTNWQLRGLIQELHAREIRVYASFFDMDSPNGLDGEPLFTELHPELLACGNSDSRMESGIVMIKRMADGRLYEDYLLDKLRETASGYGFDGFQLADGISSLRSNLWYGDFSDDLMEQAGIEIPSETKNRREWILANKQEEWLRFYRNRWDSFLRKIVSGLRESGLEVAVNSAWTRDPLEALFRYGADYRSIAQSGANSMVVEDVSSDLAILGCDDNHGYRMPYEHRKLVHFEFVSNLMCIRAQLPNMTLTPLFMIWDNQEQWDVLHHAPTAMQRAAAVNFCNFLVTSNGLKTITNGPHFCLGDALKPSDWDFIRLCIDNGYTPGAEDVEGSTFLWSDGRMEAELTALMRYGCCHSAHWLALLKRAGAGVHKIIRTEDLDHLKGDLVVTNPSLLPQEELKKIRGYKMGNVIYLEEPTQEPVSVRCNPIQDGWPYPLTMKEPSCAVLENAVKQINASCNAHIEPGDGDRECTVVEVRTGEKTSRIFVDNSEFYYAVPTISTRRKIKTVRVITKPEGYRPNCTGNTFRVRVPGRGIDIIDVVYED